MFFSFLFKLLFLSFRLKETKTNFYSLSFANISRKLWIQPFHAAYIARKTRVDGNDPRRNHCRNYVCHAEKSSLKCFFFYYSFSNSFLIFYSCSISLLLHFLPFSFKERGLEKWKVHTKQVYKNFINSSLEEEQT